MLNFILKRFFDKVTVKKEEKWHCELTLLKSERKEENKGQISVKKATPLNRYFNEIVSLKNKSRVNYH